MGTCSGAVMRKTIVRCPWTSLLDVATIATDAAAVILLPIRWNMCVCA